jgi:hypothetical protein
MKRGLITAHPRGASTAAQAVAPRSASCPDESVAIDQKGQ